MLANVAAALFEHKHIRTTTVKAKEVRSTVERLITFAKKGSLADRRQVLRTIRDKKIVRSLFDEIAPTYKDRNGGYTRVIKLGRRRGDAAEMAVLELVGYEGVAIEKQIDRAEKKATKAADDKESAKGDPTE